MIDVKNLIEQQENCIRHANTMMTMINIYKKQDDRSDSIRQCALEGRNALLKAKELETYIVSLTEEPTVIINIAA